MPGYFCIHHGRQEKKPCPICETERKAKGRLMGRRRKEIRDEVLARYGGQCAALDEDGKRCPIYAPLEIHHIDSDAMNNHHSNLVPLCRPHHRWRQDDPNATYAEPVVPVIG